jgi:hypothetical protein
MAERSSRRKWLLGTLITFAVAMVTAAAAIADAFGPAHYDPKSDQLIVTMIYDGTNPNHHFSIQWGRCRELIEQLHEPPHKIIEVDILDDQGNDAAVKSYTKIEKIPLAGLSCRPSTVTLWTPGGTSGISTNLDIP